MLLTPTQQNTFYMLEGTDTSSQEGGRGRRGGGGGGGHFPEAVKTRT